MIGPFGLRRKGTCRARLLPLAQALAERGHDVTAVLPPWDSPQDSGREIEIEGVHAYHATLPPTLPGLSHVLLARRLVTEALASRPEVIHCFKPKAHVGMAAVILWYARRLGLIKARLVLDTDDWEGPGGWNEIAPYGRMQKHLFSWQERWGLLHCHALTVASRALQTIAWSKSVPQDAVFYLPNGWQEEGAGPRSPGPKPSQGKTVLLFTRFVEFDVAWLVQVWKQVLARAPEARLLVVGKGLCGEEDFLQRLADSEGLSDSLEYAGWLEGDDLRRRQQAAQVALVPYQDTLVNRTKCSARLVDLMASGLPVVATDVGENSNYIEHGVSGWLVPADDDEALVNAVASVLKDPQLRIALGQGARQRIMDCFQWSKLAELAEQAYLRALQ
jgi:glycosyltransferase involved in cell wall biosynthesis